MVKLQGTLETCNQNPVEKGPMWGQWSQGNCGVKHFLDLLRDSTGIRNKVWTGLYEQVPVSLPVAHVSPDHPSAQTQLNEATSLRQVAPFLHGLLAHSLISRQRNYNKKNIWEAKNNNIKEKLVQRVADRLYQNTADINKWIQMLRYNDLLKNIPTWVQTTKTMNTMHMKNSIST